MAIKRRGFLQMLGGAIAAPLMPSAALATAPRAAVVSGANMHAAIYFAQSRTNFSVFTLAQRLGISMSQAETTMVEMSRRGMIGPLRGGHTICGRWATSHLWRKPMLKSTVAARALAKAKADDAKARDTAKLDNDPWADMRPFLTHLYDICRSQGRALHPRCADLIKG